MVGRHDLVHGEERLSSFDCQRVIPYQQEMFIGCNLFLLAWIQGGFLVPTIVPLMGTGMPKTGQSAIQCPRNLNPTFDDRVWVSRNTVFFGLSPKTCQVNDLMRQFLERDADDYLGRIHTRLLTCHFKSARSPICFFRVGYSSDS
ncbi:MAG: hypothetical protein ACI814_003623 [Mariniblastus sp.]|jgi:hypothetical protein